MEKNASNATLIIDSGQWILSNNVVKLEGMIESGDLSITVNASNFINVLSPILLRGTPNISSTKEKITIRCGRFNGSLPQHNLLEPISNINIDDANWVPISAELLGALNKIKEYTLSDISDPILSSIHITEEFIEATNKQIWFKQEIQTPFNCLISQKTAVIMEHICREGDGISISEDKMQINSSVAVFETVSIEGEFPSLPDVGGECFVLEFQLKALKEAIQTISLITNENMIKISCTKEGIALLSSEGSNILQEKIPCQGITPGIEFKTLINALFIITQNTPINATASITYYKGRCIYWDCSPYAMLGGVIG